MKKLITILVLSSMMLSACEGDPEIVPRTPTEAKIQELMVGYDGKIDMAAFVADAQQGVWMIDEYDMIYTNGEVLNGRDLSGGAFLDNMMLFPAGICRTFYALMYIPGPTVISNRNGASATRRRIRSPFTVPGLRTRQKRQISTSMPPGRCSNCSIIRTAYS